MKKTLLTLTILAVMSIFSFSSTQLVLAACGDTITDTRDSKTYTTVLIGNQCWMKQNLNVGTKITSCTNGYVSGTSACTTGGDTVHNQGTSTTNIEKYCYQDTESNCTTNGGLYQWNQMMGSSTTPGIQGICPTGWHIPTDTEYKTLVEGQATPGCESSTGEQCSPAGDKLKNIGLCGGRTPCGTSGFTDLLAGVRISGGSFNYLSEYSVLWSSSESSVSAWVRDLNLGVAAVNRYESFKATGISVRCIMNTIPPTATSSAATSIATSSVTFHGNITATGGENATDRGFEYGLTTAYGTISSTTDSYSTGTFSADITDLLPFTTYHYRSFALNSTGTGTSSDQEFTTLADLPVVTASAASAISTTDAILTGNITYIGGENVTDRGFEYGLTTAYGSIASTTDSYGTGEYTASLTGLTPNTTYHFRAFATNSAGTAVSSDLNLTTDDLPHSSGNRPNRGATVTPPSTIPLTNPQALASQTTIRNFINLLIAMGVISPERVALVRVIFGL